MWSDETPFKFWKWRHSQPDEQQGQDYIEIEKGHWNDAHTNKSGNGNGYICQITMPKSKFDLKKS